MVTALKSDSLSPIAMSLVSHRSELKKAITVLGRVADKKSSMPMLGAMFVKVGDGATKLVATDLNMWATYTMTPLGRTTGDAAIKVKSIADVIGKMPEGEITITTQGTHTYVMAGSVKSHVDSYVARDYPKVPDTSALTWVSVDGSDMATCIKRVISHVCQDETRFHLNGVYLHCEGKRLRAVATDGHRLAFASSSYDDAYQTLFTKGMILPTKGLKEVLKLVGKGGSIEIARDEKSPHMLHVRKDRWELSIKAIDAQFPPYEQVVPKTNKHAVAVDIAGFRGACERAKVVNGATCGTLIQRFNDSPTLRLATGIDERIEEEIPGTLGDAFKVGVSPKYLVDALEHMESRTSKIEMMVGAELDPILLFSHDENPGSSPFTMRHFVVVMPMRI